MAKFLGGVGATALVIILAFGAYMYGKNQGTGNVQEFVPVVASSASPIASSAVQASTIPVGFVNPSATISAIEENIPKKNYSGLGSFMAEKVNVIIYASSCCGDYTKAQVIDQLKYLDSAKVPWDFNQDSEAAKKLVADVPQYFKDKTIGIASNKYTVAFGLNSKYLIDSIVLVVDYSIVAPF